MEHNRSTLAPRGLAMMEVMIAIGILTVAIAAITTAIVAGQRQSVVAKQVIVGAVASESLMSQISAEPYEAIDSWNGYREEVGEMTALSGSPLKGYFSLLGRFVKVEDGEVLINELEINIVGKNITVITFNQVNEAVSELTKFVPEPST
ncbi:MAG: hypothetical protein MK073_07810 [Phycisphaerales bacterium]|nr:hypothetical protein [Phycisphaerales bacterium]